MPKQQVAFRQFVIVDSTVVDQCCRSCRVGFASPLFCFLTVYIFSVAFSVVVREPLFACCVVFCGVSRDTDDKTTVMCMLCCSMVHRVGGKASQSWCGLPPRGAHQRMVIMICSLALSRLNNGTSVGARFLWPSWSQDDEKWKSRLTWRVKKCLHWDFWQSCSTVVHCLPPVVDVVDRRRTRQESGGGVQRLLQARCPTVFPGARCVWCIRRGGRSIDHEQDNRVVHHFSVVCSDACRLFRRVGHRILLF